MGSGRKESHQGQPNIILMPVTEECCTGLCVCVGGSFGKPKDIYFLLTNLRPQKDFMYKNRYNPSLDYCGQ